MTSGTLFRHACGFRSAIVAAKDAGEFSLGDRMHIFPNGCCDDAADLFAQYLLCRFGVMCLTVDGDHYDESSQETSSHSWLELDGTIIDLTGNQSQFRCSSEFLHYAQEVYVGPMDDFHALFEVRRREEFHGIVFLGVDCQERMNNLYEKILAYMQRIQMVPSGVLNVQVERCRDGSLSCRIMAILIVLKLGRRLIIAGSAGAGKSFIMRHLFLDAIRTQQEMVPVYVELRAINDTTDQPSVLELAHRSMSRFGLKSTKEQFVRSLSSQKYLFLLDGLDEVSDSYVARLKNSIEDLAERNQLTQVIVSSRMVENEFRSWRTFVVADTVRLNKKQALSLVGKLEYDSKAKERFSEQLDARLYDQHKSFASNPLLLTMMLMVFSHKATIPDNLVTFYQQAFETLLREHDATKDGLFRRALRCGLPDDEFKLVFSNFCFTTFMRDNFAFTGSEALDRISAAKKRVCQSSASDFSPKDYLRDLTESVCMLQRDGLKYSFVHRSFQEYFAALYTMNLDDDSKVQRVVMDWLERHPSAYASSGVYLNALSNLNYDRFVRHVALRPLCDLRDKCIRDEIPEYSYLETLYSRIAVKEFESDDYDEDVCLEVISGSLFRLKEWLLHQSGVSRFALTQHKTNSKLTKKYRDDLFVYLNEFPDRETTLTKARKDGMVDAILGYWTESQRFFDAVNLLEKQYAMSFSASILDDIDAL